MGALTCRCGAARKELDFSDSTRVLECPGCGDPEYVLPPPIWYGVPKACVGPGGQQPHCVHPPSCRWEPGCAFDLKFWEKEDRDADAR